MNSFRNIVLIGFMGTGKTTVGKVLAEELDREFIDTDDYIELWVGMSIKNIFEKKGEAEFRKLEAELCKKFANPASKIISTGGGMIRNAQNMNLLKQGGKVFYLKSTPERIAYNLRYDTTRPLLAVEDKEAKIRQLLAERTPLYQKYADYTIDTENKTVREMAEKIIELSGVRK